MYTKLRSALRGPKGHAGRVFLVRILEFVGLLNHFDVTPDELIVVVQLIVSVIPGNAPVQAADVPEGRLPSPVDFCNHGCQFVGGDAVDDSPPLSSEDFGVGSSVSPEHVLDVSQDDVKYLIAAEIVEHFQLVPNL